MTATLKFVAVVQARMNSQRLPGKIMMPLAGAPMLQRIIERVRKAHCISELVVATTDAAVDDPVAALCESMDVPCHRGSEHDVLQRMLDAAQAYGADVMVRLTGDNPFVDASLLDLMVGEFQSAGEHVDYVQNADNCGFPFGLYVEVCRISALRQAATSDDPADHEHVTWYVRQRPEEFRHMAVHAKGQFAHDHLSIDTAEDYQALRPLFESMHSANPAFSYSDLLAENYSCREETRNETNQL